MSATSANGTGGAATSGRREVRTVQKPWGHETIWAHTDRYVGKILHIKAGEALSVQYHERKDETIHLAPLEETIRLAKSPAARWLDKFRGEWDGDVTRIFKEAEM